MRSGWHGPSPVPDDAGDRVAGWEVVELLCDGHPEHVADSLVAIKPFLSRSGTPDDTALGRIRALHKMGTVEVLAAVLGDAASPDARLRLAVAQAIPSCWGDPVEPRAIDSLVLLSSDTDGDVRDWATFGLGTLLDVDTPEVRDALVARLRDEHDDARAEAIMGLARRHDDRAPGAVLAELTSDSVGQMALRAAAILGDDSLRPALDELLDWWDVDDDLLAEAIRRCDPAECAAQAERYEGFVEELRRVLPEVIRGARLVGAQISYDDGGYAVEIEWENETGCRSTAYWSLDALLERALDGSPVDAARLAARDLAAKR
jgi:HEAT repeat protein